MIREEGFMDKELFRDICSQLMGRQSFPALHHLGESLLHPELPDVIAIVDSYNLHTGLSCNAAFLIPKVSEHIIRAKLDQITFCLDSTFDDKYTIIKRNKKSVRDNILAIKKFLEIKKMLNRKVSITLQMIRMKENKEEWDHIIELGNQLDIDQIALVPFGQ